MPCDNPDCLLCRLETVLRAGKVSEDDKMDLLGMIAEIRQAGVEEPESVRKPPGGSASLQNFLNR